MFSCCRTLVINTCTLFSLSPPPPLSLSLSLSLLLGVFLSYLLPVSLCVSHSESSSHVSPLVRLFIYGLVSHSKDRKSLAYIHTCTHCSVQPGPKTVQVRNDSGVLAFAYSGCVEKSSGGQEGGTPWSGGVCVCM